MFRFGQLSCQLRENLQRWELGVFGPDNLYEIWYIKQGTPVRFSVETEKEMDSAGLAAVMATGPLVEMNEAERSQREIDSSMSAVMQMAQQHRASEGTEKS